MSLNSFIEAAYLYHAGKIPPSSLCHLDQGSLFTSESERGHTGSQSGEANKAQAGVKEGTEGLEEEGEPGDLVVGGKRNGLGQGSEEKGPYLSARGKGVGEGDSGKKCPNAVLI